MWGWRAGELEGRPNFLPDIGLPADGHLGRSPVEHRQLSDQHDDRGQGELGEPLPRDVDPLVLALPGDEGADKEQQWHGQRQQQEQHPRLPPGGQG